MEEQVPRAAPRASPTAASAKIAPGNAQAGYIEAGPIIAGAVSALAVSFVLLTFGAAVGLAAVSPWTMTQSSATTVGLGSAFWILLVSLWSFALGGYLSGRMRHPLGNAVKSEVEFRDKAHGLVTWATAVVLAGIVATIAAPTNRMTINGDNPFVATAVDKITRSTKANIPPADPALRSEVSRVLISNLKNASPERSDAAYLASLAEARGAAAPQDGAKRVNDAFTEMKASLDRARKAGVIMGFLVAATLLVGAAISWWAAGMGGEHRDQSTVWHFFSRYDMNPDMLRNAGRKLEG